MKFEWKIFVVSAPIEPKYDESFNSEIDHKSYK